MKCISKYILCVAAIISTLSLTCCSSSKSVENAYDVYDTTATYGMTESNSSLNDTLMAENLCVGGTKNSSDDSVDTSTCESAAVFTIQNNTITYSKNIYEKIYPASTTKILTCLLALEYCDLDEIVTVTEDAVNGLPYGAAICGLKAGDQIKMSDLLYGLMLPSGNDAAIAIADHISGSTEAFADLMNEEANKLGATHTHFVNPNGLSDDDHYTTLYDMYLIFQTALENEAFINVISTKSYDVTYTDASGQEVSNTWINTNGYLKGRYTAPENINIIGGKTGTTDEAGCCLVLYSTDSENNPVISIIFKSDTKDDLYKTMSSLLTNFSN